MVLNIRTWSITPRILTISTVLLLSVLSVVAITSYENSSDALEKKAVTALETDIQLFKSMLEMQYENLLAIAKRDAQRYWEDFHEPLEIREGSTLVSGNEVPSLYQYVRQNELSY